MTSTQHSVDVCSCRQRRPPKCSDLFLLDVPLAPRDGIKDNHECQERAANAPHLQKIRMRAAKQVLVHSVNDDPHQQRDAGENFIKHQPTMLADQDVAHSEDEKSAYGTAPNMELL